MSDLDRRTFLLGAAGLAGAGALLTACGTDAAEPTPFLVATFPDGFRGASPFVHSVEQRVAYALHNGDDIMRANAPDRVQLEVFRGSDAVGGGEVIRSDAGVPTPYYSVWFTPPAAGEYTAVLTAGDGTEQHTFLVLEPDETAIPQPGDQFPAVDTATFDNARGVDPICTRIEPCPFHAMNLADAINAGDQPTILSIATPGFCQTAICGPVIELLIETAATRDDLNVVHAEVYVDPHNDDGVQTGSAQTTDIVDAFALPYEPALFVIAADGTVVRRLDAVYDGTELAEALALV